MPGETIWNQDIVRPCLEVWFQNPNWDAHAMLCMSPKCVLQSSSYHMPCLVGVYSRSWFNSLLIGTFVSCNTSPFCWDLNIAKKSPRQKTTLNTIRCNAMKSKRLILIILVHYKLDILVLVVWSIPCYHVVFVRNLSFLAFQLGRKIPIGTPVSWVDIVSP